MLKKIHGKICVFMKKLPLSTILLISAACVTLVIILATSIGDLKNETVEDIIVSNVRSQDLPDGRDLVSFDVENQKGHAVTCVAEIDADGEKEQWDIGLIGPQTSRTVEHKTILPEGGYTLRARVHCSAKEG